MTGNDGSDKNDPSKPRSGLHGPFVFELRTEDDGSVAWEYAVDPAHFNPWGALHGGVVMALMDTAMGYAVASRVYPVDQRINAAAQMSVHFLAPVRAGTLRATATVVKIGRRLAVVEATTRDAGGDLVATATATHALLP
jgi:uncharacterized protein (TIGR00369 family)